MLVESPAHKRSLNLVEIDAGLIVIGGGLSGVCAAIAAARHGVKTVLVQDRPVLGGNASSEVRLWVLGATSHMGKNNRWSREGGILNEILEENLYRNRLGNALIFDTILLEKCIEEKNLTLLLNTAAYDVEKSDPDTLSAVHAFCPQNSTRYVLRAPLFCDASGDGLVGFMAGAAFRMGAESREEFGEGFAPDAEYGQLLGHSMLFLHQGRRRASEVHRAELGAEGHHENSALPAVQHEHARLQLLVDRIRRPPRHHPSDRGNQVGAVESGLWRVGLHQELREVSRSGNHDARVGRPRPRQAREPPLRGRLPDPPAGFGRATPV